MDTNRLKVGIFIPCCIDQFAPQTGQNMIKLLSNLGCNCLYPDQQTCCGKGLFMNGDKEGAKQLAERLLEMFRGMDYVVSCGSGCVAYLKKYMGTMFHNSTYHNEYPKFLVKLMDITDFLVNVLHYKPENVVFPHRVVFLDHCQTLRDYGLSEEPRKLLSSLSGIELMELPTKAICCGATGSFVNHFEPISTEMAMQKVDSALRLGAQFIVGTEPTCLLHLQSYIDKEGLNIQCRHIVDLLVGE